MKTKLAPDALSWLAYALGVIAGSLVGFLSPWWFLGFLPLSVGLLYFALELEVADGDSPTQRRL